MANDCWGPNLMETNRDQGPEHAEIIENHLGSFVTWLSSKGGSATFGQITGEFMPSQERMSDDDFHEARLLGMTTDRLDFTPRGDGMSLELSAEDF